LFECFVITGNRIAEFAKAPITPQVGRGHPIEIADWSKIPEEALTLEYPPNNFLIRRLGNMALNGVARRH
jgi:hypothetical protein